ncbi:TetR/AcrR family transcriptional regulator [Paraburkholderia solisilvae]|uniref:HTH tetR-type domain-containing protein n=1 Tax=Paraburkholderia solisilvae TaxID=624376 RepID=A0A6J5F2X2_9BURK|nr:TetR/AcrR family transcriptional regulator [Paraburkholderia solisilvae]CAB3771665.1 hypothetical protein LMG29739_06082 [Paraburkholderia solisilvae]
MKISQDRLVENRRRLLAAATRLMRESGCQTVGVADVTRAAGLTHGAFYNHFSSKEDLIEQVFAHAMLQSGARGFVPDDGIEAFAREYLTPEHRDDTGGGCSYAALAAEASRLSPGVREAVGTALGGLIERLSRAVPGRSKVERRRVAIHRWSAMVGALILARAVDDAALSDEILTSVLISLDHPKRGRRAGTDNRR